MKPRMGQGRGQARRQNIDRHAGNHLIAAQGDGGEAVQRRQGDGGRHRRRQPQPRVVEAVGGRGGEKRSGQHLAFQSDINHPGALGVHAGEGGEDQRRADAKRRRGQGLGGLDKLPHRLALSLFHGAAPAKNPG
jgi:hypothetical protein